MQEIYFAGGCFWGVEHFFKGVDGVADVTPGYANGRTDNPSYEQVYTDTTGFAETVRVRYNPERVSLSILCRLFFTVTDPLTLNRQGHDEGTRYRSGVYYTAEKDRAVLEKVFEDVSQKLGAPLVTELEPLKNFYPAEEYHQNYLDKHPDGYCHLPLKSFSYLRLYQDAKAFLGEEPDTLARMANLCSLIAGKMHFFWVGFYRVFDEHLVLGPFQGTPACFRIAFGKGVCGSAWKARRTLVVPDVEEFPGHIACSSASKSEIVVPVFDGAGTVTAVLDIDSDSYNTFDGVDAAWLELLSELVLG